MTDETMLIRTVILFRDVEHRGISSVNGTSPIRFPEFGLDEFSLIPGNSSQFRNPVQFPRLQLIPDRTDSGTEFRELSQSGIGRNSGNSGMKRNRN